MDLIQQLEQLQQALATLREQYLASTQELQHLKSQPSVKPEEVTQLQAKIAELTAQLNAQNNGIQNQLASEKQRYQALEQRYQSLADSHNAISEENEDLHQKVHKLTDMNHTLSEKNRIASEHTLLVLERLQNIDSEANV